MCMTDDSAASRPHMTEIAVPGVSYARHKPFSDLRPFDTTSAQLALD